MKKFVKRKVKYLNYQICPQFSRFATIYPSRKMVTALGLFFMCEENNDLKRNATSSTILNILEYEA
jgi:hypothetical protein